MKVIIPNNTLTPLLIAIIALLVTPTPATAQWSDEEVESEMVLKRLSDIDESLFHTYNPDSDPYAEATKYYRPQLSQRRRGLDWWIVEPIVEPLSTTTEELNVELSTKRIRLYGSTRGYSMGGSAEFATTTNRGWNTAAKVDLRSGRDLSIEGQFQQDARGDFSLSRQFDEGHYIAIELEAPILNRGLQSNASQEAITLTGDYRYNPAWGLYDGEVRNSRVSKYRIPQLTAHYERPLSESTTAAATIDAKVGRRSISRLGWYDGYNPSPDYYRKLPSYIADPETKQLVDQLWRKNDTQYTQIAWDKLVRYNQLSPDGSAHYIVEDIVTQVNNISFEMVGVSEMNERLKLSYGAMAEIDNSRNFKELDDLLGADYHLDKDIFTGDYYNLGNDMQNDLRHPNREVTRGERFGYDYTSKRSSAGLIVGLDYRNRGFNLALRGRFAEQWVSRIGHYEKERFAGAQSFGESRVIALPQNSVDLRVSYSPNGRHHLSLRGSYHQLSADHRDLFVQPQSANQTIDTPTPRSLTNLALAYRYERGDISIDAEGYILYSRDETQVWSSYDDLSYTYCNVVTSDIGSRSIGLDIVGRYKISKDLRWDVTLAIGDYTYDKSPLVTLYEDDDMTLHSTSLASAVEGCKVGNAPQILATSSLTYFASYGLILSLDLSYGGGRYIAPSFVRRTDRVVRSANSPEMVRDIVTQEQLPAVFDSTISVVKTFWLANDRQLSFNLRINNLMGEKDRIEYGREANRILTTSDGASVGARYLQANAYSYGTPRSIYLSCSYKF